jgi:lipoate-protein ligase A
MRVLSGSLGSLAVDLACDEALLEEAEERGGGGWLRFWELDRLAVVLGASGRIDTDVYRERCRGDGVAIGRRSSGGGTVLIGPGALCVAVILPAALDGALATVETAQRWVLERSAAALSGAVAGLDVQGSGDLTWRGRKFAGSAQRRLRRHILVHFSILYEFPLELVPRYLPEPKRRPEYRGDRTHLQFLTNLALGRGELQSRLDAGWAGADGEAREPAAVPWERIDRVVRERMGNDSWIGRF